jgi:hypothetical protein
MTSTLDVSDLNKKGNDLHLLINNAVKDYRDKTLPDKLVINRKQFMSLTGDLEPMFNSDEYMFRTPYSIMEVQVK